MPRAAVEAAQPGSTLGSPVRAWVRSRPFAVRVIAWAAAAALFAPAAVWAQNGAGASGASGTPAMPESVPAVAPAPTPSSASSAPAAKGSGVIRVRRRNMVMQSTGTQSGLPNNELTSEIVFQVLAAEIAVQRGQVAPAYQTYLSLARETKDPRLAQRAAEIAVSAQSPSDALTAARLWYQFAPDSQQAMQLDASLLVLNGQLDEAKPLLARQLAAVPDAERGDAILSLQLLVSRGPDHIGGIRLLRELFAGDMNLPQAPTAIGRQQLVANDAPGAKKSFEAALQLKPDYEPAALLLAQMGSAERQEAIGIVSTYLQQHPNERDARFLLAQLYLADNQMDPAKQQFEALRKSDATDPAPLFALGLISLQAKQTKDAEKDFIAYIDRADKQTGPKRVDTGPAYIYLAQIAAERKDLTAADDWLAKVDQGSNQYVTAQVARAQLLVAQHRYDDASNMLSTVQPRNVHEAIALGRADSGIQMQAGHYTVAEDRLGTLLQLAPNDPDVIYDYAMAAERNGHYKRMEEELRRLIAMDPSNAQAYNALGYSLADRNERLDEADKLIQKAMALQPDDPYIMDSAGWVKYRLGNKDQAITLLRQAYQLQPNAEIGAHLGDVLWSEGKHDDARVAFRSAQELDPSDPTLLRTLIRLKLDPTNP